MKQLPDNLNHYKTTPIFTEETVPKGLLKDHNTKDGVWGIIRVQEGKLEYVIEDKEAHILTAEQPGIVEPKIRHHIRPLGALKFCVEFYR